MTGFWKRIAGLTYGEAAGLLAIAGLLLYELIVVTFRPEGWDVLTRAWRANAARWTVLPVAVGVLMGHLNGPVLAVPRWAPVIFIAVVAAALARDLIIVDPVPSIAVFGIFLLSVAIGAASWVGYP